MTTSKLSLRAELGWAEIGLTYQLRGTIRVHVGPNDFRPLSDVPEHSGELTAPTAEIEDAPFRATDLAKKFLGLQSKGHILDRAREALSVWLVILTFAGLIQKADVRQRWHGDAMAASLASQDFYVPNFATTIQEFSERREVASFGIVTETSHPEHPF